jgi:hypothetical protein
MKVKLRVAWTVEKLVEKTDNSSVQKIINLSIESASPRFKLLEWIFFF